MVLKFCPRCNGLLIPGESDRGMIVSCNDCDFSEEMIEGNFIGLSEKIKKKDLQGQGISDEGNPFASYENLCKKCGHNMAQVLDMGVFYSDEDNLIILRCGKCGFSERIGDKIC